MAPMPSRSPMLLAANSTFIFFMFSGFRRSASARWPRLGRRGMAPRASDVEEDLRNGDEVVHVQRPAQHHLDRQAEHGQPEEDHDVEARRSQLLQMPFQPGPRQERRQT